MSTAGTSAPHHSILYHDPDYFCGWPAIHGIWNWGDEILVGFERAPYEDAANRHSFRIGCYAETIFARSLDGGETWQFEGQARWPIANPARPGDLMNTPIPHEEPIDFRHPDLVLKFFGGKFIYSYDRGRTWKGVFAVPDWGLPLTSRTDYVITEEGGCLCMFSANDPKVLARGQYRTFCAYAPPGSTTWEQRGRVAAEAPAVSALMPSTLRALDGRLLTAIRRRDDVAEGEHLKTTCWLDLYASEDEGSSWRYVSRIVDLNKHNGNPASMIRLQDGRLYVTYGNRENPYGICARFSSDDGNTWSEEIVLRQDGRSWDLGYPRTMQRTDGKLVTIYYYITDETPVQHIGVTLWSANNP